MNSLDVSQIYFKFTIEFANSLLFTFESRIYYENTSCFANILRIHYLFLEFTMKSLFVSGIHYEFTIYFTTQQWIHFLFQEFTIHLPTKSLLIVFWIISKLPFRSPWTWHLSSKMFFSTWLQCCVDYNDVFDGKTIRTMSNKNF